MNATAVRPDNLNSLMEFDHVIRVHEDGNVSEPSDVWAPDVHTYLVNPDAEDEGYDLHVDSGWKLLDGYSAQDHYSGPVMHPSEFIGGRMAEDILAASGLYVACVVYPLDDEEPDGWVVAYRD